MMTKGNEMNKNNTKKHLKKGIIWTLLNRTSVLVMQFTAMIVLARFLTPTDFAVVGIALFFMSLSQTLVDSGMGGSLLRKQEVKNVDYSTLFIYNMGVAITMYLLLLILAKPLASFYQHKELASVINVIGISIVISAFGKIQQIILLRELKFKQITIIALTSSSISLLIAIIMAIKGYGVWALVMQHLVNTTLTVIMQFISNRYLPRLMFSMLMFKEQWEFGSYLFYTRLIDTGYQNIFSLVFPKISSFNFAGLFTQANKIERLPLNMLNSVAHSGIFPILAKIDDEELFMKTNKIITKKTYIPSFAILFALAIFSEQAISLLLGNKWIDAAPVLSILSIAGVFAVISTMVRNSLKSLGMTNKLFKNEILRSVIGIAMLMLTFSFGNYYILWGIVFTEFFSSIIAIVLLSKVINFTVKEQIMDFIETMYPLIPAAIITYFFVYFTSLSNISTLVSGLFIFFCSIFIFGSIFRNNEIKQLQNSLLGLIKF